MPARRVGEGHLDDPFVPVVRPRSLNTPDGSDPQLSCRAPQLNHTVDKLDNGTEYMFRVFAKFGDGDMSRPPTR